MSSIIIQGSSRLRGNSDLIARHFEGALGADRIDLCTLNIHPYDYEHHHTDDDFLPTMRKLVAYDTLIFVTPVYWYAMSGLMKNFLDRITDCLKIEKETGRKLRGKNLIAVSCGSEATEVDGYFEPFRLTAGYLGMQYLGDVHTWVEDDEEPEKQVIDRMDGFIQKIKDKV